MYLYHGTTVENALTILKERVVKGKKASRKHCNRYVSLSDSLLEARQFGEVVFQFEQVEKAIPVNYESKEWASEHSEIVEYVLHNSIHTNKEVSSESLHQMKSEHEFVVINKLRFDNEDVTIHLIGENMKDLNKLKKSLDHALNSGDTVKKSVKLYKEFLEHL